MHYTLSFYPECPWKLFNRVEKSLAVDIQMLLPLILDTEHPLFPHQRTLKSSYIKKKLFKILLFEDYFQIVPVGERDHK